VFTLPAELGDALDEELRRFPTARVADAVTTLIQHYRDGVDPTAQVLDTDLTVAAYAAYRMPATYAAVAAALHHAADLAPGFEPTSMVDVGGGTGTSLWAAQQVWPSLVDMTVLEQSDAAIALGRRLAAGAAADVIRSATWQRFVIGGPVATPSADVVTMSYVLGELAERRRADVVRSLGQLAGVLVLVEPGTPAGYLRIVTARDQLIEQGMRVLAPCPHERACPIPRGRDWCHFSQRLNRTALHRRIKSATLGFEDEKYSYVAVTRADWSQVDSRVLRHPRKRKGMVSLRLCTDTDGISDVNITKRDPEVYRRARDVEWGDGWPPVSSTDPG
jgi:ribosomal protein RSM22 (predicted rRNA methylase)